MAAGGAIWVDNDVRVDISNSSFTGNTAEGDSSEGGAIYARARSAVIVLGGILHGNMVKGERTRGMLCSLHLLCCLHLCVAHT
jgi:predicted outer membrane repeat protein